MPFPEKSSSLFSSLSCALIAAIIGFGGTIALVVQAMQRLGANEAQTLSAVTALCLGIALAGAGFSLLLRMPIIMAWSTPGAALLAAGAPGLDWAQATGIFCMSACLMILVALVPALRRLATAIPASVASAMLAGVLLPFTLALFRAAGNDALLVGLLLLVFLIGRQRFPLYAMLAVLGAGVALLLLRGDAGALPAGGLLGGLSFAMPRFVLGSAVSIGIPLFLVTLVSQNLPGLVVLKNAGYVPAPRPLLIGSGLATLLLAPFGAHGVNLAAITAAICTGKEAHPDRAQRWKTGMAYAAFYLALAAFSPLLVRFFLALPHDAIAALTGIALIVPLTGAMEGMFVHAGQKDAAMLTFAATASGVALLGIGAAFWGLLLGFAALAARHFLVRKQAAA